MQAWWRRVHLCVCVTEGHCNTCLHKIASNTEFCSLCPQHLDASSGCTKRHSWGFAWTDSGGNAVRLSSCNSCLVPAWMQAYLPAFVCMPPLIALCVCSVCASTCVCWCRTCLQRVQSGGCHRTQAEKCLPNKRFSLPVMIIVKYVECGRTAPQHSLCLCL